MVARGSVQTSGSFTELSVSDVLQDLENRGLSGELRVESDLGRCTVWFRDGQLVDAAMAEWHGEAAVIRLLGASQCKYSVEYKPVRRMQIINESASALAGRRTRRAAEWQRLLREVPSLDSVLITNHKVVRSRSQELPGTDLDLLDLVDGRRSIVELIDDSGFDAVAVLERIAAFLAEGLLSPKTDARGWTKSVSDAEDAEHIPPVTERLYSLAKDLLAHDEQFTDWDSDESEYDDERDSDPPSIRPSPMVAIESTAKENKDVGAIPPDPRVPDATGQAVPAVVDSDPPLAPDSKQPATLAGPGLAAPASAPERVVLGRYEVLSRIARGGMGTVYLCRATGEGGFRRLFALKVLRKHLSRHQQASRLFLQEARIAAGIHHPNVVSIIDVGMHDGQPYIVMDYVEGCSFQELLKRHPEERPTRLIVPIVLDALGGLHAAHTLTDDAGEPLRLIHCDVSPHNMLVGMDGACRLADFGITKATDTVAHGSRTAHGKPGYISPEQAKGEPFDHRADIFAAGVVLFNALTGERLFDGEAPDQIIQSVLRRPIPAPSTVGLHPPASLDAICLKALARDPAERFQTAEEMLRALRQVAMREDMLAPATDVARWVTETVGAEVQARRLALLDASRRSRASGTQPLARSLPELDRPSDLEAEPFVPPVGAPVSNPPPSDEPSTTMLLALPEQRRRVLIAAALFGLVVIGLVLIWPSVVASWFSVEQLPSSRTGPVPRTQSVVTTDTRARAANKAPKPASSR